VETKAAMCSATMHLVFAAAGVAACALLCGMWRCSRGVRHYLTQFVLPYMVQNTSAELPAGWPWLLLNVLKPQRMLPVSVAVCERLWHISLPASTTLGQIGSVLASCRCCLSLCADVCASGSGMVGYYCWI
jgi:hypothetical protein